MQSLKSKALKALPSRQLYDLPTDVLVDTVQQYLIPIWIIKVKEAGFNDENHVFLTRTKTQKEAVINFILDDLANLEINLENGEDEKSILSRIKDILYESSFLKEHPDFNDLIYDIVDIQKYRKFILSYQKELVDYFLNRAPIESFMITELELNKYY